MPKNQTTLKKGENLPSRGKSNKNRILDAIRSESIRSLLGLIGEPSRDQAEEAFFSHIAKRAFNIEDKDSATLIKVLSDKGWSSVKPSMEKVEFKFDSSAHPVDQANQVLDAISNGLIAPDVGNLLIDSISKMLKIEEITVIKTKLDALEKIINERTT